MPTLTIRHLAVFVQVRAEQNKYNLGGFDLLSFIKERNKAKGVLEFNDLNYISNLHKLKRTLNYYCNLVMLKCWLHEAIRTYWRNTKNSNHLVLWQFHVFEMLLGWAWRWSDYNCQFYFYNTALRLLQSGKIIKMP